MKIFYQRSYSIAPYLTERIGFEDECPDNIDPMTSIIQLKELCDKAHKELNPDLEQMKGTTIEPVETIFDRITNEQPSAGRNRGEIIQAHITTINECKTLRNLEMFANMVQRENVPELYEAYNNKKKELQSL